MNTEIKIFEGNQVNIINENGEPLFEIYSTGMALGQVKFNSVGTAYPRKDRIDENLKSAGIIPCVHNGHSYISEEQLYDLMFEMKTDKVKPFRKWVTKEVLPSIRKHGLYAIDEVLNNPDMLISALTELKVEREKRKNLEEQVAISNQLIGEMQPKVSYYDIVLDCSDLISTTTIAKDYGKSAKWLNNYLHEKGVQYKQGNKIWLLYQKYAENGYTSTKTHTYEDDGNIMHTKVHTYWTQKGRLFIYDLLKNDNVLPLIER
jgi:phage antirepressor YoqD-like protein